MAAAVREGVSRDSTVVQGQVPNGVGDASRVRIASRPVAS